MSRMSSVSAFLLSISSLLVSIACATGPAASSQPTGGGGTAPTATISANPATINSGDNTTLTWSTTNATSVSIDGIGTVPASGNTTIPLTATTTYTLRATNSTGTQTSQVTVTVQQKAPAVTATLSADPGTITAGGISTLTWTTTNASDVTIDNGLGVQPLQGSLKVDPTITTTYTLTAKGDSGSTTATTKVTVNPAPVAAGVYTYMYNNGRTGANTSETQLTPANVKAQFGLIGNWPLDGKSYTQPLFVPNLQINGGTHNVVYVGTENDSLYALDADTPGSVLWKRSFLTSTATIGQAYHLTSDGRTSLGDNIGITGTPVIDPDKGWMYLVARTTEGGKQVQRIHAIDIHTGSDVMESPAISAESTGKGDGTANGTIIFDPLTHSQRPGLVLSNGVVYVSFASFSDYRPYHGWVIAFDASTLNFIDGYNSTPNGSGGGVWTSGAAPAADDAGNIYLATGNAMPYATGVFDPPTDMPQSILKLKVQGNQLSLVDYFSPRNAVCLTADDLDLGSGSPTLIPDPITGKNALTIASKEGRVYLMDSNNLGKFNASGDSQIMDSVLFNALGACGSAGFDANAPWRVYGVTAYWNGSIYFGSAFGPLRKYDITTGKLKQTSLGTYTYAASGQTGRGPMTIVSSNGTTNGIVWTNENNLNGQGWLRAYDATNLANQLFASNYGAGSNFVAPTQINGRVYVVGKATLYMYGLK